MKTKSTKTAFWIVAWILTVSLWSSSTPSIEFPVYATQWHLTKSVTTAIFSTFPITLVVVLVLLGNISDYLGRRNTLLTGLVALLLGSLVFGLAPDTIWLFVGRALQGIGVGLTVGAGTTALVEFNPTSNKKLPGSINTITQAVGLFLATIIGAALIKYAPKPLYLSYWVLAVLTSLSIILCLFLPNNKVRQSGSWKIQGIKVPSGSRSVYILAALAVGAGMANGAVFQSLGAQIAREVVGTQDILVIGTVLSISYLMAAVSATIAGRIGPVSSIRSGMVAILLTMTLLLLSSVQHSFILFIMSSVLGGLSYGFSASGGIGLAAIHSPVQYRVQFISAVFVVSYLFQGASASGGGVASTALGFDPAIHMMAAIVGTLAVITLLISLKKSKKPASVPAIPEAAEF